MPHEDMGGGLPPASGGYLAEFLPPRPALPFLRQGIAIKLRGVRAPRGPAEKGIST